jgi:putative pre-16S rRNA nuclease
MRKVLALDYGTKRVGVATGEADFGIAFPRAVIENKGVEGLVEKINDLCEELEVDTIVVGLPLNMDEEHEENEMMQEVRYFVNELRETVGDIDVELFDERLSTFEGKDLMRDAKNRSGKQELGRDAYAAQVILQRFFDKLGS